MRIRLYAYRIPVRGWRIGLGYDVFGDQYFSTTSTRDALFQKIMITSDPVLWIAINQATRTIIVSDAQPADGEIVVASGLTRNEVYHQIEPYMKMLESQG